jgi:ABC-type transport system involved in multi-copper enzyme maturation permease subunit
VIAHWQIRRFWIAILVSALATTITFMVVTTAQSGFPNPFKPIALLYFSGFALLVSAQVGAAFVLARHRQRELA